jgi:hypothetical protein
LTVFFEDVLLPGTNEPIVIFVDEIDTTIALPFTDDFFAAVRACYNARATKIEYQRMNFVLLGVAGPSDLIKDTQRTPFNIGHGIHLTDFTPAEARPLSLGLCADPGQGEKMLARILYWTGGHPYLTQKLCRIAAHEKLGIHSDEVMDNLVEKNFLSPGTNRQEPNLKFVGDRLMQDRKNSRKRLKLYRRIYNKKPVLDDPLSPTHVSLKLSGIVVPRTTNRLSIRNLIYERTFTGEWIKEVIPTDWNRNIAVVAAALLLSVIVTYFALILPRTYINDIRSAQEDVPIDAYDNLKGIPFYKTTAENLFADYWHRRALRDVSQGKRDEGLIYHLKALQVKELKDRRKEAGQVIGDDYKKLMVTYRHNSPVSSVAFSPDGKTVLTGSSDGTARLWDAATGKSVSPPMKHGSLVYSVAFSPDGKTIMAATGWWIHQGIVSEVKIKTKASQSLHQGNVPKVNIKPKASRLLPGNWMRAYRFLDEEGDQMQVVVRVTGDSIKIVHLRFDKPNAPPIEGDPAELLDLWQKKLALKLNEKTGKIEPMYPLPEVKNAIRRPSSVIKGEDDKQGER